MILLIADNPASTLSSSLTNAGPKTVFLHTGVSLFSKRLETCLEDPALEVAVIECVLDDQQCLALLRSIKARRFDVPLIFVCSSDSDHIVSKAFRLGARDCFTKPFDEGQLRERILFLRKLKSSSNERRHPFQPHETHLGLPARISNVAPDNILRVIRFIENHLSDRGINIERLARIAGMSPFHFCRVFKKYTQISPMQFIARLRVEKAIGLLRHNSANMTVSLIATTVGFYDSSNFNKHFKKSTGLTPTAFKMSLTRAITK
jgi:AraC family transcriptional regulator